eukprot:3064147-Pyramimonas_sp.AAC.1
MREARLLAIFGLQVPSSALGPSENDSGVPLRLWLEWCSARSRTAVTSSSLDSAALALPRSRLRQPIQHGHR